MKLSYKWLKELVNFDKSPDEIAGILTFLGFETKVVSRGAQFKGVVTAKVVEKAKHPNADKLSLCKVSDGANTYSVVCGAPNVEAGQIVPFAMLGAELPQGFKIERRKLRGVESEGMICSSKELGIIDETQGIMVLEQSTPLGKNFCEMVGDDDSILELETTTNRPDCLNHIGAARELSAYFGKKLAMNVPVIKTVPAAIDIEVLDNELCPRYLGVKISGLKVSDSPDWLKKRLEKSGLRPINNIVDITNYVLIEYGHPLHAFDCDKLEGGKLIIRKANDEKIVALDKKVYTLDNEMLVIADKKNPQAIAGVMGGEISGVTFQTKDIILESAVFNPRNIRKTSKKLNLSTDSSYRFERGSSWEICEIASNRAVELILSLCGGQVEARKDMVSRPYSNQIVELRMERIKKVLGLDISKEKCGEILNNLNMQVEKKENGLKVTVPSWRMDVTQEIDLIEEVARVNGYDKIPVSLIPVLPAINDVKNAAADIVSARLVSLGFNEVVNYSFTNESVLNKTGMKANEKIGNPLSAENELLRPSLLPGLLSNIDTNIAHGVENLKLFELGNVFGDNTETKTIGIVCYGNIWKNWWKFDSEKINMLPMDLSYLTGVLKVVFNGQEIKISNPPKEMYREYFHPGKYALLKVNGKMAGMAGAINPKYTKSYGREVVYAEIEMGSFDWKHDEGKYVPLKKYPVVKRDLSVVVDKKVTYDKIEKAIGNLKVSSKAFSAIFEDMALFSIYEMKENDKLSYSFHFTFQHEDHTLAEIEINAAVDEILKSLEPLGVTLRT